MAIPNFNKPGPQRVDQTEVLYSPQNLSKPAQQKPMEMAPSIGGQIQQGAQGMANRMLPRFNNGNPMGANNMSARQGLPSDIQDFFNRNQASRNRLYGQPQQRREIGGVSRDDITLGRNNRSTMPVFNTMGNDRQLPGDPTYYGGQAPGVGRYRPPTMDSQGRWQDGGGYNYNLPNAFGSYPGYGQGDPSSGSRGPGYDSMFGGGQNPQQFQQMMQQLMMYLQGGGRGG